MKKNWQELLQEHADKSAFWIFSVHYPWDHPNCPLNMRGNMTLMGDGFPIIRLKVIEGGKWYRLLQYHFRLMADPTKRIASGGGHMLRAMQESMWHQNWDERISEDQLREWMTAIGFYSCSHLNEVAEYIKKHGKLPPLEDHDDWVSYHIKYPDSLIATV